MLETVESPGCRKQLLVVRFRCTTCCPVILLKSVTLLGLSFIISKVGIMMITQRPTSESSLSVSRPAAAGPFTLSLSSRYYQ